MDKVNQIINHPLYMKQLALIDTYEAKRIFCGHDFQHFMDVARIGYIYVLENGLQVDKEVVYAYGVLHDIGRAVEYGGGESHDLASIKIAREILEDTTYTADERKLIIKAIGSHRDGAVAEQSSFEGLMYKADKASRACWQCPAESQCYWDKKKKNLRVEV